MDLTAQKHALNPRQGELLAAFAGQQHLALAKIQTMFPEVTRRTLQRDLKHLVALGLVLEQGQGPHDPTRHDMGAPEEAPTEL